MTAGRRWLIASLVSTVLVVGLLAWIVPPAQACVCRGLALEEHIEAGTGVFIAEPTSRVETDTGAVFYDVTVTDVLLGSVPENVIVNAGELGTSCSVGDMTLGEPVALVLNENGRAYSGMCSPTKKLAPYLALFDGTQQPEPGGVPSFLVTHRLPRSTVALVDEFGVPVAYGPSAGAVHAIAVCPAAKASVEVVSSDQLNGEVFDARLLVRDLATLEVINTRAIEIARRRTRFGGVDWLVDLECHDETGSSVSYLLRRQPEQNRRAKPGQVAGAVIHVWRGDAVSIVNANAATASAVDLDRERIHVVDGEAGESVTVWDLASRAPLETYNLEGMAAVDVAIDGDRVVVIGRHLIDEPKRKTSRLASIEGETVNISDVPIGRKPLAIISMDDGVVVLVREGGASTIRSLDGTVVESLDGTHIRSATQIAFGSSSAVHVDQRQRLRLLGATADVASLTSVTLVAAFPHDAEGVELDVRDLGPTFARGGEILPGGETVAGAIDAADVLEIEVQPGVVDAPPVDDAVNPTVLLFGALLLLGLVGAVVAKMRARR